VHSTFQFVVTRGAQPVKGWCVPLSPKRCDDPPHDNCFLLRPFWPSLAFNQTPRSTGAEKPGKAYWEQLHAREQHLAESFRRAEPRWRSTKAVASEIAQAGAAIQPALIEAKDGPAKPVVPSHYQRHPDQFRVGIAGVRAGPGDTSGDSASPRRGNSRCPAATSVMAPRWPNSNAGVVRTPADLEATARGQPGSGRRHQGGNRLAAALVEFFEQAPHRLAKIVETLKELKTTPCRSRTARRRG
jgi:hypothetical protein